MTRETAAGLMALAMIAGGALLARRFDPRVVREDLLVGATPATRFAPREGAPRGTALLAHGITSSRETLFVLGEALAREGFEALAFDFPGHGDSNAAFEREACLDALAAAARALDPAGRVDVIVGHSMGGGVGAAAVSRGLVPHPGLFVALGAGSLPEPRPDGARALLATGRHDVLAPPSRLEGLAARTGASLLVGPSDHVLEPYDPALVRGIVNAALASVGAPPRPEGVPADAPLRALGALLVLLAALPLLLALPAPRAARAREGLLHGALAGGLAVALVALALDGAFIGLRPHLRHALPLALLVTLGTLAPWAAGAALARVVPAPTAAREALLGLGALALAPLAAAIACALAGAMFWAMLSTVIALVALGAAAFGALVARRAGHALAGHAAFAVVAGYWPAQLATVFL